MIMHVEMVVHRLLELVGGWIFALGISLLVVLAAAAFLGLNLFKFDRTSFNAAARAFASWLRGAWAWMLAGALLLICVWGLATLQRALADRLAQESQARYIAAEDQGGGPTVQRAPSLAYLEATTREQRLVVPSNVLNVINASGINALPGWSPEEARYDGRPAVRVDDQLVKDDKTVVINRTTTVERFVPLKLARSDVDLRLDFQDRRLGQRRQFYKADFSARYAFQNPFPDKRRIHFVFPLPDNSGTLSGFKFRVNGKEQPPGDIGRGFEYEADMAPAEKAQVEVSYANLGSGSWTYDVAGRREPIADFHLQVRADKADVKFRRGSLYPTRMAGSTLGWDLENQITSQSICLYFSSVSRESVINSLFIFCPVGLLGFAALMLVWGRLRRAGVRPWTAILAGLTYCAAFALTSYLLSYVPLLAAIAIAFALAALLQLYALGRPLWIPVAICAIVPLAFLPAGHTGLLLSLLGMATLAITIRETRRTADVPVHPTDARVRLRGAAGEGH